LAPGPSTRDRDGRSSFDSIVLGGGAAGCVLAARLSEDPARSVCLVEAGPDYGADSAAWPETIMDARALPRDHVWESRVPTHRIRAKILGGSSSINGCWHTWGAPADYARWAEHGGPSWSETVLDRYREVAAAQMALQLPPEEELSAWSEAALSAAASLGFPVVDTAAPSTGPGVGSPLLNARDGVRWNAALAYLGDARTRPNLTVLGRATVDRLVLAGDRVTAAEIVRAGRRIALAADEYVLACGAFGSPAVLMRSGVGPAGHLAEVGVPAQVDLPGVGENLGDHPGVFVLLAPGAELNAALAAKDATGDLYGSRVLIRAASSICADGWDLHVLPTAGPPLFGSMPRGTYEVGISVFVLAPASRGRVRLASRDPDEPLRIDPAFLLDRTGRDLAILRSGLEVAEELAAAAPLARLAGRADATSARALSDAELRARAGAYWHPVGTCAVGPEDDPLSVVDHAGRVHGILNLRVVDASVLPDVPAANTQLSVLAVAEMLAAEGGR
jgi:choline dehydrogenase